MKDKDAKILSEAYEQINEGNPFRPIPDVVGGLATGDFTPRNILGQLSPKEIDFLRAWVNSNGDIDLYSEPELVDKLHDYYSAEMPYGVQKARTGDPEQWLLDKLSIVFDKEDNLET